MLLEVSPDDARGTIARVEELRRRLKGRAPCELVEHLQALGLSSGGCSHVYRYLSSAQDVVAACDPERGAADDLARIVAIFDIAASCEDLVERAATAADHGSCEQSKGAENMTSPVEKHVDALCRAEGDEAAFRKAVSELFRDKRLDANGRKSVTAAVTGAPARRIGSDEARRDELERWSAAKLRRDARSEDRMSETSRF